METKVKDEIAQEMQEKAGNQEIQGKQKKQKNYARRYVIAAYITFWVAITLVGVAFVLSGQNPDVMNVCSIFASWTPTIVLMVMFPKIFPNITRKEWIKKAFTPRIKIGVVVVVTIAFFLAITGVYLLTVQMNRELSIQDLSGLSIGSIFYCIFFAATQGATGEEAGWRGFLQNHFEEKNNGNVIKSACMVALCWSFWHTPLWFSTGFTGLNLLVYIVTFILGNFCIAIVIAVCYSYCRNLFIPMWIHFITNLFATVIEPYLGEADSILIARWWLVLGYGLVALGFGLWYAKGLRSDKRKEN